MAELIGQTLGNYRVEALLGRGGMGAVYRATHLQLDRPAAIKVMHPHLASDPDFQARFRHEARLAAGLDHPNIVHIYEFGEQDGFYYLIMELVPDGPIRELVKHTSRHQPGLLTGLDLIRQAAEGLAYAHRRNMVHRDIKPDNLLLERVDDAADGPAYRLHICDFGLTRMTESSILTASGLTLGTPAYMSPEQCSGAELDGRADQYSLGVVLYELVTGRKPFDTRSLADAVYQHLYQPVPPPNQLRPDLPGGLEYLILRCLAKQPQERYPTCSDLARALSAVADGARARQRMGLAPPPALADPTPTPPVAGQPPPSWPSQPPPTITPVAPVFQPVLTPLPQQDLSASPAIPPSQSPPSEPSWSQFSTPPVPHYEALPPGAVPSARTGRRLWSTPLVFALVALVALAAAGAVALNGRGGDNGASSTATRAIGGSSGPTSTAGSGQVVIPPSATPTRAPTRAPTSTATATATHPAQVTSPPKPVVTATPRPTSTATPVPTDTPTPSPTPLPSRPPDGNVLAVADLAPLATGEQSWGTSFVDGGSFHARVNKAQQGVYFHDDAQYTTDFSATVELRRVTGDGSESGCLMINIVQGPTEDSEFSSILTEAVEFCLNGSLATAYHYHSPDGYTSISLSHQEVNPDVLNALTIVSKGDDLWFAVNGVVIGWTNIPGRPAGYVGVLTESSDNPAEYTFANLTIRAVG